MYRNLIVCLALALVLPSTSYGEYLLGDWEDGSVDGWDNAHGWGGACDATLTPGQTIGVTKGAGSLKVEAVSDPGYWWLLKIWCDSTSGDWNAMAAAFTQNHLFKVDVTRLAGDWPVEDFALTSFQASIQCAGPDIDWMNKYVEGELVWDGRYDNTATLEIDYINEPTELLSPYGSHLDGLTLGDIVDLESWRPYSFLIAIGMVNACCFDDGGIFYFDNARLVPEPATLLLFGLGGLMLRRRK